jgi:hypothetical protein
MQEEKDRELKKNERKKMRKKIRKAAFMTEKAKKTMHSRIFL